MVVRTRSNDSAVRTALVAEAQVEVKAPAPKEEVSPDASLSKTFQRLQSLGLPVGWKHEPTLDGRAVQWM